MTEKQSGVSLELFVTYQALMDVSAIPTSTAEAVGRLAALSRSDRPSRYCIFAITGEAGRQG